MTNALSVTIRSVHISCVQCSTSKLIAGGWYDRDLPPVSSLHRIILALACWRTASSASADMTRRMVSRRVHQLFLSVIDCPILRTENSIFSRLLCYGTYFLTSLFRITFHFKPHWHAVNHDDSGRCGLVLFSFLYKSFRSNQTIAGLRGIG